jgi:hypothetical protein
MPSGRTHPRYNRLVVSQDGYHDAMYATDDPESWIVAALLLDRRVDAATGYLSPDRRWLWQDRRHFYE